MDKSRVRVSDLTEDYVNAHYYALGSLRMRSVSHPVASRVLRSARLRANELRRHTCRCRL